MLRERAAGSYRVSAYFLAKTIADMSFQIISPVIFTVIVYPRIGIYTINESS
jgi:ATP-binding cassette subfamily G (WHITE) protein 2